MDDLGSWIVVWSKTYCYLVVFERSLNCNLLEKSCQGIELNSKSPKVTHLSIVLWAKHSLFRTLVQLVNHLLPVTNTDLFLLGACAGSADIVFALDASGSIGDDNFRKETQFVTNVIASLDIASPSNPNGVQVGLLTFSDNVSIQFQLNNFTDKRQLLEAINAPYTRGSTNTAYAIRYASLDRMSLLPTCTMSESEWAQNDSRIKYNEFVLISNVITDSM